jgi:hypothetical protein
MNLEQESITIICPKQRVTLIPDNGFTANSGTGISIAHFSSLANKGGETKRKFPTFIVTQANIHSFSIVFSKFFNNQFIYFFIFALVK